MSSWKGAVGQASRSLRQQFQTCTCALSMDRIVQ